MPRTASQVEEARRYVRMWKPLLALRDWTIRVRGVVAIESAPDSPAQITYYVTLRRAEIQVATEPAPLPGLDLEMVIVHELLHLVFDSPQEVSQAEADRMEQGINTLAATLVRLRRRTGGT